LAYNAGMASSLPVPAKRVGFFRILWRAMRQVFHETTGAVFFLLALSWTGATIRLWRHGSARWTLVTCGSFALMLVIFGFTAFRSARRVR
jgi:hypothetical protein